MLGFNPNIQAVMDCRYKSGNDRGVARRAPNKKWGTILKKGAPHFPIFPVVEPFCEGAHCLSRSGNTASDGRYVQITVNGNPFSSRSSIYEIEMPGGVSVPDKKWSLVLLPDRLCGRVMICAPSRAGRCYRHKYCAHQWAQTNVTLLRPLSRRPL